MIIELMAHRIGEWLVNWARHRRGQHALFLETLFKGGHPRPTAAENVDWKRRHGRRWE